MATSTQTITTSTSSDTVYRETVTNLKAGIEAAGLVQTSDTGQISNLSTLTRPSANTQSGYFMFRFDDALQSGAGSLPCFLKIEPGVGNSQTAFQFYYTIGTGTNGSGTITGQASTRNQIIFSSASATTYYFSGENGNRLTIAGDLISNGQAFMFNLERLRNSTGAVTADGFSVLTSVNSSTTRATRHFVIPSSGSVITQGVIPVWPDPGQTQAFNQNVYFSSHYPQSYMVHQPNVGLLKYWYADFADGSTLTVGTYGSNNTYRTLGFIPSNDGATYGFRNVNSTANVVGLAIRWQ